MDPGVALSTAISSGRPDIAAILLRSDLGSAGGLTTAHLTDALAIVDVSGTNLSLMTALLASGADPNGPAPGTGAWTPLHTAADAGATGVVGALLAHKANPNAWTDDVGPAVCDCVCW